MGAWGHKYFEDDAALDFMADIEDTHTPYQLIENSFKTAIKTDYLEYDEGNAVIVSAAYVDGQVNGSKFSEVDDEEPLNIDTFPAKHPDLDLSYLKLEAVQALEKVLGGESELNSLWMENEDEYPAWRQGIERLIDRLQIGYK